MSHTVLTELRLTHLMTHFVGNRHEEEGVRLSDTGTSIKRDALEPLMNYLFSAFKKEEFYNFSTKAELGTNEVFDIVKRIFKDQNDFVKESQRLAELLYEAQDHPSTRNGNLLVVRVEEATLDGEILDAIGIFKAETLEDFLKMDRVEGSYAIDSEKGYAIKGLDKGCIIFDTEEENGYRILIHNSKSSESGFWGDKFLRVVESSDDYHHTKEVMHMAKDFVDTQMPQEFEVDKADRIALLNRSMEYFTQKDSFDGEEFAAEVFEDENVAKSFQSYNERYRQENLLDPVAQFDISPQAVKKQGRVFKSVLKLDKNFHIYIHGDRNLIERGQDDDGRKFYKVYYEQES